MTAPANAELKVVKDATCTFCGCVCDDIDLTVDGHGSWRPSAPACWARPGFSTTKSRIVRRA